MTKSTHSQRQRGRLDAAIAAISKLGAEHPEVSFECADAKAGHAFRQALYAYLRRTDPEATLRTELIITLRGNLVTVKLHSQPLDYRVVQDDDESAESLRQQPPE